MINAKLDYDPKKSDEALRLRIIEVAKTRPIEDILDYAQLEMKNETQVVAFNYTFKCFIDDGAYAVHRAVTEFLGVSQQKKGFFGTPPQTIDVEFADGSRIKVPWGTLSIPSMGEDAELTMKYDWDNRNLYVNGKCERRYVHFMDQLMSLVKKILKTDSIYRGKAIKLNSELEPEFLDLSNVKDITLYLTPDAEIMVKPILARIHSPEFCLEQNLDLKYGALIEGRLGTGKTLLAFKLGLAAIENDWTFIYLTDPEKTDELLEIAGELAYNGNGVVVFVEDIDLVLNTGVNDNRTVEINRIVNLMDGGDNKGKPIISLFSTNHISRINKAFIRAGRTGGIITLDAFDQPTANKYLKDTLGKYLDGDVDTAAKLVEERRITPSFLKAIVDRVIATTIYDKTKTVNEQDIITTMNAYQRQMDLAHAEEVPDSPLSQLVNLVELIGKNGALKALIEAKLVDED